MIAPYCPRCASRVQDDQRSQTRSADTHWCQIGVVSVAATRLPLLAGPYQEGLLRFLAADNTRCAVLSAGSTAFKLRVQFSLSTIHYSLPETGARDAGPVNWKEGLT